MFKSVVAVVVVGSVSLAHADEDPPPPSRPPLSVPTPHPAVASADDDTPRISGVRLAGEALLGSLFAVGGGYGGLHVGRWWDENDGGDGILGAYVGSGIGLMFAPAIGVYLVGSYSGQTGSGLASAGGSVIGALLGMWAAHELDDACHCAVGFFTPLVAGPVLGSMLGFNLTRRYDRPRTPQRRWVPVASATPERATLGLAGSF